MQSKVDSLKEVVINTSIGLVGAVIITRLSFHFVSDLNIASLTSCGLCTIWSIVRGYNFRRYFESKKGKENA